jgi:cobalt-zinc-cadmium resistance protein CzcA
MGPVATGLGEVFHYMVTSDTKDLTEARTVHDWLIKPALLTVRGVAEVNSWGGFGKPVPGPHRPDAPDQVRRLVRRGDGAVEANNLNAGWRQHFARRRDVCSCRALVASTVPSRSPNIVVKAKDGVPIHVHDVADVQIGSEIRRGAVTYQGQGEAVLGLGFMLMGENAHEVTTRLKAKLQEIKSSLPPGTHVQTVYDRTELVDHVIDTVRRNLFEGGLLVIAVLFMFLGNCERALIGCPGHPTLDDVRLRGDCGSFAIAGSLMSLGRDRLRPDRVTRSVIQIENTVPPRGSRQVNPADDRRGAGRRYRSSQANHVWRIDHHAGVRAHPYARRNRGQAVPADGADGDLCLDRFVGAVADAHAGAGQPAVASQDQ